MSYQVLARKWRPHNFAEVTGQEHVLKALMNALQNDRLHHAYLFTGTRGVGKTTIARILAKCLNCEQGVTSEPCGQCSACVGIDEGRFVDLIEVDAASRTKVEDTRELLDNVQYAPTQGRYKVYLIDEVHMLSTHSFNALLKTLEEPPPHIKFLLATTDPQKLPVTVLSRCLQFNLRALAPERLVMHLKTVLDGEKISYTDEALWHLARAADGSVRDVMSLTDQAIAYGNQSIQEDEVCAMLGTLDKSYIFQLLDALLSDDGQQLMGSINQLAEHAPDYVNLLEDFLSLLHQIAVSQIVPDANNSAYGDQQKIQEFTGKINPEDLQLYYQIGLIGRRDLPLAPDMQSGFEMVMLRMLAFKPTQTSANKGSLQKKSTIKLSSGGEENISQQQKNVQQEGVQKKTIQQNTEHQIREKKSEQIAEQVNIGQQKNTTKRNKSATPSDHKKPQITVSKHLEQQWYELFHKLTLSGMTKSLAAQCVLVSCDDDTYTLAVAKQNERLLGAQHQDRIQQAITEYLGKTTDVKFVVNDVEAQSPAAIDQAKTEQRRAAALSDIKSDPNVKMLVKEFDGEIQDNSLTLLDNE